MKYTTWPPIPGVHGEMARMRNALDAWLEEVGDLGRIPESEMVSKLVSGGTPARDRFRGLRAHRPGKPRVSSPLPKAARLKDPCWYSFTAPRRARPSLTRFETGDDPHWRLYTGPLRLDAGEYLVKGAGDSHRVPGKRRDPGQFRGSGSVTGAAARQDPRGGETGPGAAVRAALQLVLRPDLQIG